MDATSFSEWMRELDSLCFGTWGLSISDLPDMCFRDAYDDGVSAVEFFHGELGSVDDLSRLILS